MLGAVFDGSADLVVMVDRDGRVAYRNPADRARGDVAPDVEAALAHVRADGKPAVFEWGEMGPGGVRAWFAAEARPYDGGALCVSRDITSHKTAEERLRRSEQLMVDTQGVAHLGTWEWDVSLPTATWSAELFKIYGLTPETYTPSYEAYLTKVHPDDRQRVIDATNRVFHEHVPYSHDERILLPDGSIRYLHTWAYPVLADDGKLIRLVGVCQDITDRALAELELQRLNAELEQRVIARTRELEAFNSMVSHDLRAPLAVIQMSIDLLAKKPDDERVGTYVERIRRAITNMSSLMDDLMAFARVGQAAIQPQPIDVSALCNEIAAELRLAAPQREATVAIEPDLRVVADPALFRVVMANLLGNAWKYTQQAPAAVIEIGAAGHGVFVRDNGIGFDMTEAARLFAPFERLSNARDLPGTGVGLATVQKILERHGGTIAADSRPGAGATFIVRLPS